MFNYLKKIKILLFSVLFTSSPIVTKIEQMSAKEIENYLPKISTSPFPFISSVFNYRNEEIREIIYHIKYRGNSTLVNLFAEILYQKLKNDFKNYAKRKSYIHLIPIPLSKKRLQKRKFNQSELLTNSIIKHDKQKMFIHSSDVLIRKKDTKPQTKLNKKEREKNIKDCFLTPYKKRKEVEGNIFVLVDDVTTTGSTLKEARQVLLESKAKEVYAVTLAH
jgi:competence protein ComFC